MLLEPFIGCHTAQQSWATLWLRLRSPFIATGLPKHACKACQISLSVRAVLHVIPCVVLCKFYDSAILVLLEKARLVWYHVLTVLITAVGYLFMCVNANQSVNWLV